MTYSRQLQTLPDGDIINLIAHQTLTNGVAERFDVSRQAISRHIKILTECGIVTITRQGREHYCFMQPKNWMKLPIG